MIPAWGRLRQEYHCEFGASLSYKVRHSPKPKNNRKFTFTCNWPTVMGLRHVWILSVTVLGILVLPSQIISKNLTDKPGFWTLSLFMVYLQASEAFLRLYSGFSICKAIRG